MENSIVPLDALNLTALIHRGIERRKIFWEATCPELDIFVRADSENEARVELQKVVHQFLQTASPKEIEENLAKGTAYSLAPLQIAPIVRSDNAEQNWLQRVPAGAVAAVGVAKNKAGDLATTVGGVASTSGHFVSEKAVNAYDASKGLAGNVYHRTHETLSEYTVPLLIGLTEHVGNIADILGVNPNIKKVAKTFKLDHWLDISNRVDIEKAARVVAEMKAKYPVESNRQIAGRLIMQKAVYAGGVGLSTSLLPGVAIPLLALDLAATALLQAELVFQIAAIYGLDLEDPARKGEMLAVFGCVLGGGKAVNAAKVGLEFLRNAPVAGAVTGTTSNAAMIYALGNVACSFYEKKLYLEASPEKMEEVRLESALYLAASAHQQAIADQILMHVVFADNPAMSKTQMVAALRQLKFSSASLETMGNDINLQQPLDELLPQLDREFANYVATKAQEIARADGVITDGQAKVLERINRHFAENIVTV